MYILLVCIFHAAAIMALVRAQQVVQQARTTFTLAFTSPAFASEFERLRELVKTLTSDDFRVTPRVAASQWDYLPYVSDAPAACMEVFECPEFSMSIFFIKPHKAMPLHDHPGMYGIMKVLFGSMKVASYSKPKDFSSASPRYLCSLESTDIVTAQSEPCCLQPTSRNIHEISVTDGPVAFVDILAPPYNPQAGRDCIYYHRADGKTSADQSEWLRPGPNPAWFSCVPLTYEGPIVD